MKRTFILFTILTMVGASAFCCCFQSFAEAAVDAPEMSCHGHEAGDQATTQKSTADCDCADLNTLVQNTISLDVFVSPLIFQAVSFEALSDQLKENRHLAYLDTGPPHVNIPIYLQNAVLRI